MVPLFRTQNSYTGRMHPILNPPSLRSVVNVVFFTHPKILTTRPKGTYVPPYTQTKYLTIETYMYHSRGILDWPLSSLFSIQKSEAQVRYTANYQTAELTPLRQLRPQMLPNETSMVVKSWETNPDPKNYSYPVDDPISGQEYPFYMFLLSFSFLAIVIAQNVGPFSSSVGFWAGRLCRFMVFSWLMTRPPPGRCLSPPQTRTFISFAI